MNAHARKLSLCLLLTGLAVAPLPAQWSSDPTVNQVVVDRAGDQALPKSAATSDGGCWVAWFDNASGNYDVYVQRFDSKGSAYFADGGLLVSDHPQSSSLVNWDLIADSADAAVLTFTDTRDGGDLDVHAYRIDGSGSFTWGPDGVTLSSNSDFEADPMVAEASDGDFVFVWGHFPTGDGFVVMQRLDPFGSLRFGGGPVTIAGATGETPGFADLVPSTSGDVIVSWVRDIGFASSMKFLRAARFDNTAGLVWGSPVQVFDAFNLPIAYSPKIVADGSGGAILAWHASNSGTNLFESFVQHLGSGGTEVFGHNGTAVSTTAGVHHLDPSVCFRSATSEAFVFWNQKNAAQSQSGLQAQKLDVAGARQWGGGGVNLMAVDGNTKFPPRAVQVGDGAVGILTWEPNGIFGDDEIVAVRVDGAGATVWPGTTRDVCSLSSGKSVRLALAQDFAGETVVFWEDDRNGDDDVFGQNLMPDGTLGEKFLFDNADDLSLAAGGTVSLSLEAGERHAFRDYWLLGSINGTTPGVNAQGFNIPLNQGLYFDLTLDNPTHPLLTGFRGSLDSLGLAFASVTVPAGFKPGLAGRTVNHAYVVLDGNQIALVSEAEGFLLTP